MKSEIVLWGVRKDNQDWQEEILSTNPAVFEKVKVLATRDGFNRFRVAKIDLSTPPDFRKTLST